MITGHIERRFVEVPIGATWVEGTIRTSGFDTPRKFFISSVQVWFSITKYTKMLSFLG